MRTLDLILYFVAAACFGLAVKQVAGTPVRINWLALGLLAWVLVSLISTIRSI